MPKINAGANVTLALSDWDSVTVATAGVAVLTAVSGLDVPAGKMAELTGSRTFGPFAPGSLRIDASVVECSYETADGVRPVAASGGGVAAITGSYVVGQTLTATFPAGITGTIQFTRTLAVAPFTKTAISGAVASAVNSLAYQVQQADVGYSIGVDCTTVTSASGATVPIPPEPPAPAATVQSLWTGVPKTDGAVISAKLNSTNTANSSRVAVSLASNLSSPVYSSIVAPDATYRVAKHELSGLQPNTEYFYGVEVDGALDATTTGRFKTLPAAGPANFSIVMGGCAENTSDASFAAFSAMNPKPLFLLAMGDFQYMDIAAPTTANYHAAFDTTLARAARKVTHSQIPTVYTWDDHDFGTDNSTGRDASNVARSFRATGLQFFRDRIPAVTASSVATDTAHYSFVVGRVRFVVSDMRSDKTMQSATDNVNKTMMGAAQKAWFKAEIAAAKAAGQVVAWVNSVPWVIVTTAGADEWGGYTTERTEISDYVKAQDMSGKVFILSADMHALAIHVGADYATGGGGVIPVFHAGPFNRKPSNKGGPYTYGPYPIAGATPPVQQYGTMDVTDDGATLTVTWTGYTSDGTARMSHTFSPITPPAVVTAPSQMSAPVATAGAQSASVQLTPPASNGGAAVTGYTVTSSPAGGVDAAAGTTALTRTITGLTVGVAYRFTAVAQNSVGSSPASPQSNEVIPVAPSSEGFAATGGAVSDSGGYRYWTFNSSDTLNVTSAGSVEFVVVAGGGGGSTGGTSVGAGGGAGGLRSSIVEGPLTIQAGSYAITVGQGGVGGVGSSTPGTNGGNSSIGSLIVSTGGGSGGNFASPAGVGGSGGGGNNDSNNLGAAGTAGQGYSGGSGSPNTTVQTDRSAGGGGGSGGPGVNGVVQQGGNGGAGTTVFGRVLAGGGGGGCQGATQGLGVDGGGNAAKGGTSGSGAANTGSGGGGGCLSALAGAGGSGVVIIRRVI